ncbi:glycosyltransferase family 4 protein [Flavobacteriaceae bacterium M23B6Z8]
MIQKPKILFLVQMPPPVHGVSMMNEIVVNSQKIKNSFWQKVISLNYTNEIKGIGKFSFKKAWLFFFIFFKVVHGTFVFRPDIIYFTISPVGISFYRDLFIVVILKISGKKIVYHIHGKGIYEKCLKSPIQKHIYSWVFKNTDVIHLSTVLVKDLSLLKKKFRSHVVPNGISKEKLSKSNHKEDVFTILFLSNIAENKGIYLFLNTCAFLKKQNVDFRGLIVGRETTLISKEILNQRIKKLDLNKEVDYLGPKYGSEKESILDKSHLFVFPTYNDCFPLVLLEAQKYGLPIISTDEGAISEIVDNNNNGYIVQRLNQNELNIKVLDLIKDKNRLSMFSLNASKKFNENYTVEIFQENITSVLLKILND